MNETISVVFLLFFIVGHWHVMGPPPPPLLPSLPPPPEEEEKKEADASIRALLTCPHTHTHTPPTWVGVTPRESACAEKPTTSTPPTWVGAGHWCVALADLPQSHTHTYTHERATTERDVHRLQPPPKKTFKKARQHVQRLITRQLSSRTATPKRAPEKGAPHTHTHQHTRLVELPKTKHGKTSTRLRA